MFYGRINEDRESLKKIVTAVFEIYPKTSLFYPKIQVFRPWTAQIGTDWPEMGITKFVLMCRTDLKKKK